MRHRSQIVLSPVQRQAYDGLLQAGTAGEVLLLKARGGHGRTTILRKLHRALGGAMWGVRDSVKSLSAHGLEDVEDAFLRRIEQALAQHETVIVDDLHLVTRPRGARAFLLDAALTTIVGEAVVTRKRLVFGSDGSAPWPVARRAFAWKVAEFSTEDYAAICRSVVGEAGGALDFARIYRSAPGLNAGQLRRACKRFRRAPARDTGSMIECLRAERGRPR